MKKYLLPETGNFYKANLHCHTVFSDGHFTPAEIRALYRSHGYSIVAFTDHDVLIPHPELRDETFLPLNAMEFSIRAPEGPGSFKKLPTVHLGMIAKEEDNLTMPLYHRTKYIKYHEKENRKLLAVDESEPDYERGWEVEKINETIAIAKEKGFFVIYNHPEWSLEDDTRLTRYRGLDAIEVHNSGSSASGFYESTPNHYKALARHGIRLSPVAADDNHNEYPFDSRFNTACRGWVQIKAEKLEYRTVTAALEKGDFYASTGPEIHALWTEGGRLHVRCSPADDVCICHVGGGYHHRYAGTGPVDRHGRRLFTGQEAVTEASFPLVPERGAVILTVFDKERRWAITRFYYPEEW